MFFLRKIIVVFLSLILVTSFCFATEAPSSTADVQPYYVGTKVINENFQISTSGKATMVANLTPINTTVIDEVKVNLIIKNANGVNVYNKTFNAEWNSIYGRFGVNKTYQLSAKGSYQFQAIYKCYKNGSLVETINSPYKTDSY